MVLNKEQMKVLNGQVEAFITSAEPWMKSAVKSTKQSYDESPIESYVTSALETIGILEKESDGMSSTQASDYMSTYSHAASVKSSVTDKTLKTKNEIKPRGRGRSPSKRPPLDDEGSQRESEKGGIKPKSSLGGRLKMKNGIQTKSLVEKRDEQQANEVEVDEGKRESEEVEIKPKSLGEGRDQQYTAKKELTLMQGTEEGEQPDFIQAEKVWMSAKGMTRNAVWDKFESNGDEFSFHLDATAEEKGQAVVAAFANYKALQAEAEQKAIDVENGRKHCNESQSVKEMKARFQHLQILEGDLVMAKKEKSAAKSKVLRMWKLAMPADQQKAVGGLGDIEDVITSLGLGELTGGLREMGDVEDDVIEGIESLFKALLLVTNNLTTQQGETMIKTLDFA